MSETYSPTRAIQATQLHQVGGRPPLREYLQQLRERRHFISMQAWSSATHQHRGMLLGNIWMILAPILDGLMYFLVFGVVFQVSRAVPNYPGYLVVGILMFSFTSRCLTSSVTSLHASKAVVQAFTFPRAALPLATVLRETIATIPVVLALFLLLLLTSGPGVVSPYWVMTPLIFLLHAWLNVGFSLIVARWGALFPDVRQMLSYGVRLLIYSSAVIFTMDRFTRALPPAVTPFLEANPLYIVLTMYRDVLLYQTMPPPSQWAILTVWSLAGSIVGIVYFWQAEVRYGRRR